MLSSHALRKGPWRWEGMWWILPLVFCLFLRRLLKYHPYLHVILTSKMASIFQLFVHLPIDTTIACAHIKLLIMVTLYLPILQVSKVLSKYAMHISNYFVKFALRMFFTTFWTNYHTFDGYIILKIKSIIHRLKNKC